MGSDEDSRAYREQLKGAMQTADAVGEAVLQAAGRGEDELRDLLVELSAEQARLGATYVAVMHAEVTRGGLRHVPDDDACEALLEAADEGGFRAALAVAGRLDSRQAHDTLGELAMTYRSQRADELAGGLGLN